MPKKKKERNPSSAVMILVVILSIVTVLFIMVGIGDLFLNSDSSSNGDSYGSNKETPIIVQILMKNMITPKIAYS